MKNKLLVTAHHFKTDTPWVIIAPGWGIWKCLAWSQYLLPDIAASGATLSVAGLCLWTLLSNSTFWFTPEVLGIWWGASYISDFHSKIQHPYKLIGHICNTISFIFLAFRAELFDGVLVAVIYLMACRWCWWLMELWVSVVVLCATPWPHWSNGERTKSFPYPSLSPPNSTSCVLLMQRRYWWQINYSAVNPPFCLIIMYTVYEWM